MIIIKKKNVLHELAVSLFLMLAHSPNVTASPLVQRVRDRAEDALQAAAHYTGVIGDKDVSAFLTAKPLKFSIDCGRDIIKGDTIRFIETVFNNKVKPARRLGTRGVVAEVTSVHYGNGSNPILYMKVLSSRGTWELNTDIPIRRILKNVARTEVMRVAWENETRREEIKNARQISQQPVKKPTMVAQDRNTLRPKAP